MSKDHPTTPDLPDDVVLRVSGVSKKFCRNLRRSMWYGIQDLSRNLVGKTLDIRPWTRDKTLDVRPWTGEKTLDIRPWTLDEGEDRTIEDPQSLKSKVYSLESEHSLRPSEFWALRNVSFDLKRGECLGLIGRNGCGKTTGGQTLDFRHWTLDAGEENGGGASLERPKSKVYGLKSSPMGRENVYLNGAILGLHKSGIDAYFDEIVDFAEIGAFSW